MLPCMGRSQSAIDRGDVASAPPCLSATSADGTHLRRLWATLWMLQRPATRRGLLLLLVLSMSCDL